MVQDIDKILEDLTGQYDENMQKINELTAQGLDEEAWLYRKQNERLSYIINQLLSWKQVLGEPIIIPIAFQEPGQPPPTFPPVLGQPQVSPECAPGYVKDQYGNCVPRGVVGITPAPHGFFGVVRQPTLFLAGERGPETVSIVPQGQGRRAQPVTPIFNFMFPDAKFSTELDVENAFRKAMNSMVAELMAQGLWTMEA